MSSPGQRLRLLRQTAGFASARAAAIAHGWNEVTYASHENGIRRLTVEAASRYAAGFGSSPGYLLFGEGASVIASSEPLCAVFGSREARQLRSYLHSGLRRPGPSQAEPALQMLTSCFGFLVSDDALCAVNIPKAPWISTQNIAPGDLVLCHAPVDLRPGCLVLASVQDHLVLRQWRPSRFPFTSEEETGHLVAFNPAFPPILCDDGVEMLAVACGVVHPFDEIAPAERARSNSHA